MQVNSIRQISGFFLLLMLLSRVFSIAYAYVMLLFILVKIAQMASPVPEFSFLSASYRGRTRAGENRVQDNLHGMLRTPPFFPPIWGKTIFGSTFQIWLVARFSE